MCICVPACGSADFCVESKEVNTTLCSRTKLGQKLERNKATQTVKSHIKLFKYFIFCQGKLVGVELILNCTYGKFWK